MSNRVTIQYNTAELKRQRPIIAASRVNAIKSIIEESYFKATGLAEADPAELWLYAFGRSEPRTESLSANALKNHGDLIRQYDPGFNADANFEEWQQFWQLGGPTLCGTVQHLAARIQNESQLAGYLAKLLKLRERDPITR